QNTHKVMNEQNNQHPKREKSVEDYMNELPTQLPSQVCVVHQGPTSSDAKCVPALETNGQIALQPVLVTASKPGFIARLRHRGLRAENEIKAIRIVYQTEIEKLRHQAAAAVRESKAFWDAKSVEISETIKTYVQATLRALEVERSDTQGKTIFEAATR